FSMLNATGGALADSIAVYVTPANVILPLALGGLGWWTARARRTWRDTTLGPRARALRTAAFFAIAGLGWWAAPRVATLGLHRNAVLALVTTSLEHLRETRDDDLDADRIAVACAPRDGDATDLRDLRGIAAGRNVVWVILESTAARFLAPYGAARDITPHLAALARDAVIFDNAYAAYPESIKGLYSMLCAHPPFPRREAEQHAQGRAPCVPLPGRLREAGYHPALFHSGRFAYLGMDAVVRERGFEVLEDGATIGGAFKSSFGVDEASTVRKLLGFVDGLTPGQRFFAVYIPIAGHHPYHAPGAGPRPFPEDSAKERYFNDLYAGDAALGSLRDGLKARGLDDQTLYVIVGDHGEAFFEHEGNFAHTLFLYEENVRVPFIVAAPGRLTGVRRAPQLASLIDVGPTLLDLLGLPAGPVATLGGQTLLEPRPRLISTFTDQGLWQSALRDGPWKLIQEHESGRARLFNLAVDPGETTDLAPLEPARALHYRACLRARGS
ncbi:MAG TPA: sulfatase, partial [Polyangia bacterium]|nr:sulfatase [Polyangia bacterium]